MVTAEIQGLDKVGGSLGSLPALIEAGVKVEGEAAAYALVWEWGSARLTQPGPKTVLSTNPDGVPAILTLTAPHGFIRVNKARYMEIVQEEIARIPKGAVEELPRRIREALGYAMERCSNLIVVTAPYDTGLLASSIKPVADNDPLLGISSTALEMGAW